MADFWMYSDITPEAIYGTLFEAAQVAGFDIYNSEHDWLTRDGGVEVSMSLYAPFEGAELDRYFSGQVLNESLVQSWFEHWLEGIWRDLPDIEVEFTTTARPARNRKLRGKTMYDLNVTVV